MMDEITEKWFDKANAYEPKEGRAVRMGAGIRKIPPELHLREWAVYRREGVGSAQAGAGGGGGVMGDLLATVIPRVYLRLAGKDRGGWWACVVGDLGVLRPAGVRPSNSTYAAAGGCGAGGD